MAFQTSSSAASINVTPLIDVLLVLIIIFMVISPLESHGLRTAAPESSDSDAAPPAPNLLVVNIAADHSLRLGTEPVPRNELAQRLHAWASRHAQPILFVAGAPELEFREVANVIDTARGAGVERVALMPAGTHE